MHLNDLSDSDFEELIYDLLECIGFKNVSWRKGTGKYGRAADQGRDITAEEVRTSPDGHHAIATWFVQCKHYKSGVPPQKLEDALAWASAERPNVLLIVASNFLSNPTKDYLDTYKTNNRPPFEIRIWEKKDLERLIAANPSLLRKYDLGDFDPLRAAHPAHLMYVGSPTLNTIDYLFQLLDRLPAKNRDEIFGSTYFWVVKPRFRDPESMSQTLAELQIDATDYEAFREKCYELKSSITEYVVVRTVIGETLAWNWRFANPDLVAETKDTHLRAIEYFEEQLRREDDDVKCSTLRSCIERAKDMLANAETRQQASYTNYLTLCNEVILPLLIEDRASSAE